MSLHITANGILTQCRPNKTRTFIQVQHQQNRFLFYPWGIFVTAYARRNLFTGIHEAKDDYIYSDTDSIKIMNGKAHEAYFKAYNMQVQMKLRAACKYHGLPFSLCEPQTIKGITKTLGVWDFEGTYTRFKTLGAKRYMVQEPNALKANGRAYDFSLTVSGVNKKPQFPTLLKSTGQTVSLTLSLIIWIYRQRQRAKHTYIH